MERVMIEAGTHRLEAVLNLRDGAEAVVLCHPHPLYGGAMDTPLLLALERLYGEMGWGTVRFNFRGVGRSTGAYGGGDGEAEDVLAVCRYLAQRGCVQVHLAGYSFGAWVALKACAAGLDPAALVLVSPAVTFLDFRSLSLPDRPSLVIVGDQDTFAVVDQVRSWHERSRPRNAVCRLEVVPGCDHFYWGKEGEVTSRVRAFLESWRVAPHHWAASRGEQI
ncbi:hypothetical protein SAMN02746041_00191 [Desulfacinum hydrothermale DSM 13146]|uniref:AB hydrolase-1 domain-containing protein n=1 Tax=Desulfacinum hydrothermale DSM 13146 TaxID=1121390 RepID=A0A1W1WZG4_9BACT|nr:alpha/beta fold hydrolase [Desulfacinum hydrothermale]SMC16920.1 hypothetical protein SAMN02746041_00191 [Desulfacinum hydrothermale DSM 13146]